MKPLVALLNEGYSPCDYCIDKNATVAVQLPNKGEKNLCPCCLVNLVEKGMVANNLTYADIAEEENTYDNIKDALPDACRNYTDVRQQTFCVPAWELDHPVFHYHGRNHYTGPAVKGRIHDLGKFLSKISVPCQWDNLGSEYVVYPK